VRTPIALPTPPHPTPRTPTVSGNQMTKRFCLEDGASRKQPEQLGLLLCDESEKYASKIGTRNLKVSDRIRQEMVTLLFRSVETRAHVCDDSLLRADDHQLDDPSSTCSFIFMHLT
jgi:hypothetical protein